MASATTFAPSSGAENPARPPWNFPMGVRTPERMTGVSVFMRTSEGRNRGATNSSIARCQPGRFGGKLGRSMLRPSNYARERLLICGGGAGLRFISAGTIEAGHRNVHQAKIYSELRTMMIMMVQNHAANRGDAGHGEDFMASSKQPPVLHHFGVADAL